METSKIKKALQKTVKGIREDLNAANGTASDFPKTMMTGQQMAKNTATVNCGGEWASAEKSLARANAVVADSRFKNFLAEAGATAKIEVTNFGSYQVRINY